VEFLYLVKVMTVAMYRPECLLAESVPEAAAAVPELQVKIRHQMSDLETVEQAQVRQ
jgi:hypothetical protein